MSIDSNASPQWLESQYLLWKENPDQLDSAWQSFFQGFELGQSHETSTAVNSKAVAVQELIHRYRDIGHYLACVDPLTPCHFDHPQLRLEEFGLDREDLEKDFIVENFILQQGKLKDIIEILNDTYYRYLGVEFTHITILEERQWLQQKMESTRNHPELSLKSKLKTLQKLQEATAFERFLHKKFLGQKRFSLEGAESLIPMLSFAMRRGSELGINNVIIGMPHRGRLNVLATIFGKPLENIFTEFEDNSEFSIVGEGDVKYHKGYSADRTFSNGKEIHISLASNPSHLEAVNPVVEGKARARQDGIGDGGMQQVMPLLIHGDAAFSGQGVVAEVLNLSQLEGFRTGGTLHIVVNNQIGFTTLPVDARSTCYPTDMAKILMAPIFHVHGDNPEALLQAVNLALEFRQKFAKDVVIEMICYRRHGHNEGDEPFFTQPMMYEKIKKHPPAVDIYRQQLIDEGVSAATLDAQQKKIDQELQAALDRPEQKQIEGFMQKWSGIERDYTHKPEETGVSREKLINLTAEMTRYPANFTPHKKLAALMKKRREMVNDGHSIDWGTGEALAFATLLNEGSNVRISGQDSRRGTFNHRHAALIDMNDGRVHIPLQQIAAENNSRFTIYNSMLSEFAVLGFEYGYSVETPDDLTIWEAQFGDFANGAQVIIDQFIASSLTKWDRSSALTMFLPHGYEGQGPEHSSARIERFLQLCGDENMQVIYPTTPAQLFHMLRRQIRQLFRRPLIVFTPKGLLRNPLCTSPLEKFTEGSFQEIIADDLPASGIKRVLLCSGRIYYDLLQARIDQKRTDIALVRIEQLFPLHLERLHRVLADYRDDVDYFWVQEEPANSGAWRHLRLMLTVLLDREPLYIGRKPSASTAVGSHRLHKQEQQQIINQAFEN
ncbi:MAG TPA: 2-oxoglutarate dehydrogenase E1 component [Geopsychrobacteraceae bacterium]|nr:2-oxoglutarate dehydrogenase E1 component [Geopsychrobacteraceae bacterium]